MDDRTKAELVSENEVLRRALEDVQDILSEALGHEDDPDDEDDEDWEDED